MFNDQQIRADQIKSEMEAETLFEIKREIAEKRNSAQPSMTLKESSPAVRFAASSVKANKFGFDIK